MTPLLEFTVPGKPMAKQRVRVTRTGHAFTPERTMNYEALVMQCCSAAMNGVAPYEGALRVSVDSYLPVPKSWSKAKQMDAILGAIRPTTKPDGDNLAKAITDAGNRVVWVDDSQIVSLHVDKWYSETPHTKIVVDRA
jgi:Holliday junction resolvase RusA-like endonuclease